jgi:hypothetical protein
MGSNFFDVITDTTTQQSIELATALAQIQASGGSNAIAMFSGNQRASLMNTIMKEHSDTAAENIGDLARSQDSLNNVMYYYSRNNDVNNIQSAILDRARSEAQGAARDSQLSKRQFEINEWTSSNKAETLFMMQLLLIAVTFTIFMLFLNRMEIIPTSVFSLITALVFIAFIFTFVVRYQYTNYLRDGRYWNRKNYGSMASIKAPDACPGPDSSTSTLSDLLGEFGDNAGVAFNAFNQFTSNVGRSVNTASEYYRANTGSNVRHNTGSNAR